MFLRKEDNRNCILLETDNPGWMTDTFFASPGLKFYALNPNEIGLVDLPNPYRLKCFSKPDYIFISTNWYLWLKSKGSEEVERIFKKLRQICDKIIAFEGYATFNLGFPADGFRYVDILLKAQGVFRDKELYNYKIGTQYPGANWTSKIEKMPDTYGMEALEKIKLSFPCMLATDKRIRRIVRKAKPDIGFIQRMMRNSGDRFFEAIKSFQVNPPQKTIHFVGAMTHVQRMEVALQLKGREINGLIGITGIPPYIWGTEFSDGKIGEEKLAEYRLKLKDKELLINKMNRITFRKSMLQHKAVLAPCGYGELSFRMAEAWELARMVICQDFSHVNTMYPFKNNENIIYCRPDFSDLLEKTAAIENDEIDYKKIGETGKMTWDLWIKDYKKVLSRGILKHLAELN